MSTTSADRHLPVRTCVGCRRRGTQDSLYRCVVDHDGRVQVSRTGAGRGAWICGPGCVAPAVSRRGFDRAWRRTVPADVLHGIADLLGEVDRRTHETRQTREKTAVRSGSTRHERLTTRVKG